MFQTYTLTKVPHANNAHADALAALGSTLDYKFRRFIPIKYLGKLSIEEKPAAEVLQVNTTLSWQNPIIDCLVNVTFSAKRLEAKKLQIKAARYYM